MIIDVNNRTVGVIDEVTARLLPNLQEAGDEHTRYASTTVPSGSDEDTVDVLVQTAESGSAFALWYGSGLPQSCDDCDFAPGATCTQAPDGSIVAWFEEVREDDDGEPYELVRILVAFRSDGLVVTVNRYADAEAGEVAERWAFETLQALAAASAWRASA